MTTPTNDPPPIEPIDPVPPTPHSTSNPTPTPTSVVSALSAHLPCRIYLVGYRCVGKSTMGKQIAEAIGWRFIDADEYLEQKHRRTIAQIFADEGEISFRDKEERVMEEIATLRECVVATGGGCVIRPGTRMRMKRSGFVVWMQARAETLFARMQQDPTTESRRPPLTSGGLEEVQQLLTQREPYYAECAHFRIFTEGLSSRPLLNTILKAWNSWYSSKQTLLPSGPYGSSSSEPPSAASSTSA